MSWAGTNWNTGILVNGRRYQRTKLFREFDLEYDEDLYAGLW